MSNAEGSASTIITIADPACHGDRSSDSYSVDKAKLLARLRRIEGQVRGIEGMVEDDRYCIDILTQISAVISSLQSVGLVLLEDHIEGCVVNADPEDRGERLQELNKAIARFTRSVG
jgi:CsoR family transcriptional regulator, copper-sensing transcriptional repressor